ncbi:MAG: NAD-binding protein, partial [Nitriliruptoraceae bacterium]
GVDGLLAAGRRPLTVIETSTLALEDRWRTHDVAADAGVVLLDCPISGTAQQALDRDVVVFASGDLDAIEDCRAVFEVIAREHVVLGTFGTGSTMKYLANHLVVVHTAAAAEAIVLGIRAGLDPGLVVDTLTAGAGNSRMLEVRGPLIAADTDEPVHMSADLFTKDLAVIAAFAEAVGGRVPLLETSAALHRDMMTRGLGHLDLAAIRRVLDGSTDDHGR